MSSDIIIRVVTPQKCELITINQPPTTKDNKGGQYAAGHTDRHYGISVVIVFKSTTGIRECYSRLFNQHDPQWNKREISISKIVRDSHTKVNISSDCGHSLFWLRHSAYLLQFSFSATSARYLTPRRPLRIGRLAVILHPQSLLSWRRLPTAHNYSQSQ